MSKDGMRKENISSGCYSSLRSAESIGKTGRSVSSKILKVSVAGRSGALSSRHLSAQDTEGLATAATSKKW